MSVGLLQVIKVWKYRKGHDPHRHVCDDITWIDFKSLEESIDAVKELKQLKVINEDFMPGLLNDKVNLYS